MPNPALLIVEATPNPDKMDDLQSYTSKAPAIAEKHGAVPVAKYDVESAIYLVDKPAAIAIFTFPNSEAIENLFNDPDYQKLIPFRDKGFKDIRFLICREANQ